MRKRLYLRVNNISNVIGEPNRSLESSTSNDSDK